MRGAPGTPSAAAVAKGMVSPTGRLAADHPELLGTSGPATTRAVEPAGPAGDTAAESERSPTGAPATRPGGDWDRVIASVDAEDKARRTPYAEEPTEVLGPFDVGQWTLQGKQDASTERTGPPTTPPAPAGADRPPARPTPTGPASPVKERPTPPDRKQRERPAGSEQDDARLAAVVAAAGRGPGRGGGGRPAGTRPAEPDRPARGDRGRTVIRGLAQVLITLGIVLLLFAAYEVWFTGVLTQRAQDRLKTELDQRWKTGEDPTVAGPVPPGTKVRSIPLGEGFALIYIPDFGPDYVYTVVEGTGTAQLNEGPGHYVDSALPGEVGNFAVAGHRVGKGSPFLNLDKLKVGSAIVIRTRTSWYTYRVLGDPGTGNPAAPGALGIPGMQVVDPTEVGAVAPVPDRVGVAPTQRLLTLTTCHPKFSARQRLVIHAQLEGPPRPTSAGLPPALASAGG